MRIVLTNTYRFTIRHKKTSLVWKTFTGSETWGDFTSGDERIYNGIQEIHRSDDGRGIVTLDAQGTTMFHTFPTGKDLEVLLRMTIDLEEQNKNPWS